MAYDYSVVMIVADAMKSSAIELGRALGFEGGFSVELRDGEGATHWGLHTWATGDFLALLIGPSPEVDGFAPEQVAAVRQALTVSAVAAASRTPAEHFDLVVTAQGLSRPPRPPLIGPV